MNAEPGARFRDFFGGPARQGLTLEDSASFRLTYSGRGAIYRVLRALPPEMGRAVLVPAFHCPTVVDPVVQAGYRPIYYRIRCDLSIDASDLDAKICPDTAAVIVINFFGFSADLEMLAASRARHNFVLIEDCAHSFLGADPLRLAGGRGDVDIYSFKKLLPMGAGGGVRSNADWLRLPPSQSRIPAKHSIVLGKRLVEQAIDRSRCRPLRAVYGFLERRRVALKMHPAPIVSAPRGRAKILYTFDTQLEICAVPRLSKRILATSDLGQIVQARQRNYRLLATRIKPTAASWPLFPVLPAEVCPWAFPLVVPGRERFDLALRETGIPVFTFGETLAESVYQSDPDLVADARYLSNNLLLVPIHQNLSEDDMYEFSEKINAFFEISASVKPSATVSLGC